VNGKMRVADEEQVPAVLSTEAYGHGCGSAATRCDRRRVRHQGCRRLR
jgi:hypothetical protein